MNTKIDCLGRLVIPKKMREALQIDENDNLNIELKNNKITISKRINKSIVPIALKYIDDRIDFLNKLEDECENQNIVVHNAIIQSEKETLECLKIILRSDKEC